MQMKCYNCGSNFDNVSITEGEILLCPFCKNPLTTEYNSIKGALRWLVKEKGTNVFNNSSLLNGTLADLVKGSEREKQKIRLALHSGAGTLFYKILIRSNGCLMDTDLREFKINLADFGFASDFSDFILNTFLYSVSLPEICTSIENADDEIENNKEKYEMTNSSSQTSVLNNTESNLLFSIELIKADSGYLKFKLINFIREIAGFGLKEAKNIVENPPRIVMDNLSKQDALNIKKRFEEYGAVVSINTMKKPSENKDNLKTITNDNIKSLLLVENTFEITGRGTVVVGSMLKGSIKTGDHVDIILKNGQKKSSSIVGIEVYRKLVEQATTGDNVGLILQNVKKHEIDGCIAIVNQGVNVLNKVFNAHIYLFNKDEGGRHTPIFNHYYPFYKFPTGDVKGTMTFSGKEPIEMLMPGSEADIRVELDMPLPLVPGLSFIMYESESRIAAKGKITNIPN